MIYLTHKTNTSIGRSKFYIQYMAVKWLTVQSCFLYQLFILLFGGCNVQCTRTINTNIIILLAHTDVFNKCFQLLKYRKCRRTTKHNPDIWWQN